jgi:hypothetical protein
LLISSLTIITIINDRCSAGFTSTGNDESLATLLNDVISFPSPEVQASNDNSSSNTTCGMQAVKPLQTTAFYGSRKRHREEIGLRQPSALIPEIKRKSCKPLRYNA